MLLIERLPVSPRFVAHCIDTVEVFDRLSRAPRKKFTRAGAAALGSRRGSEVVTSHINLTDPDTFDANATFVLFDAAGNVIGQGCPITESGTRLE